MEVVPSINAPSQPAPASALRPDQSRVVETGGVLAVKPKTTTPTAPSSLAQQGAVTQARLSDADTQVGPAATRAPERVLKPFGVAMLPEGPVDGAPASPEDATDATSAVETEDEA